MFSVKPTIENFLNIFPQSKGQKMQTGPVQKEKFFHLQIVKILQHQNLCGYSSPAPSFQNVLCQRSFGPFSVC
jgi:hypothetical protein